MLEDLTPPIRNRGSCKVGIVASQIDEANRKILLDAVADVENWPVKSLSNALNDRGIQLSGTPIANHRSKACACFRLG